MIVKLSGLLLTVLYPLVVVVGLRYFDIFWLAFFLILLAILNIIWIFNWLTERKKNRQNQSQNQHLLYIRLLSVGLLLLLCVISLFYRTNTLLKIYPVLVSLLLFTLFFFSLFSKQSVIERLARIKEKNLPDKAVRYTRKVTVIWAVFFVINALIAGYLAIYSSDVLWGVYTGMISYIIIGLIFLAEFCFRKRMKQNLNK